MNELIRILTLGLVLLALIALVAAALNPASKTKGRLRLLGSFSIGAAFFIGAIFQALQDKGLWPSGIGIAGGIWLTWLGIRKYRRDPEGKTPAATIL